MAFTICGLILLIRYNLFRYATDDDFFDCCCFTYELGKREQMDGFSAKIPLSSWSNADDIVAHMIILKQNETVEAKKEVTLSKLSIKKKS